MKTEIRTAFAIIATSASALALSSPANAAAYKVSINGKSEVTCSASAAAWKFYTAAKTGITSGSLEQFKIDSPENQNCIKLKAEADALKLNQSQN